MSTGQSELNVLIVGTIAGQLDMFAYGILPIGGFDALDTICRFNYKYQIVSAELSDNLGCLCVVIEEFKVNVDRRT